MPTAFVSLRGTRGRPAETDRRCDSLRSHACAYASFGHVGFRFGGEDAEDDLVGRHHHHSEQVHTPAGGAGGNLRDG